MEAHFLGTIIEDFRHCSVKLWFYLENFQTEEETFYESANCGTVSYPSGVDFFFTSLASGWVTLQINTENFNQKLDSWFYFLF